MYQGDPKIFQTYTLTVGTNRTNVYDRKLFLAKRTLIKQTTTTTVVR